MRCKKHNTDLSSIVGLCASCLRERLFSLILAQEQSQAQSLGDNNCNLVTNPAFPSSSSPYITRRKSDNSVAPVAPIHRPYNNPRLHHSLSDKRFHNSPQIGVNTGGCIGGNSSNTKKQSLIRFSSFSNLFRSNSRNGDSNPTSVTSSPSLFSNVPPGVVRKQRCVRDRGMSPARSSDDGGEDEFNVGSSEYESAESCKQTPKKTPSNQTVRRGGGGNRSVSELIFCLSPLVRASPNRLWNLKGKPPSAADGDDARAPVVHQLSYAKSFCANRSRKLADFGRSDPNR